MVSAARPLSLFLGDARVVEAVVPFPGSCHIGLELIQNERIFLKKETFEEHVENCTSIFQMSPAVVLPDTTHSGTE